MTTDRTTRFGSTEAELTAMTADLDALHHDVGVPALRDAIEAWGEELTVPGPTRRTSRRRFLLTGSGVVAGGAALAALSASPRLAAAALAPPRGLAARSAGVPNARGGLGGLSGDLAVAGLAASLENLAVFAYRAGISVAQAGKLGTVPPAVVTFAQTAMSQHVEHAAAWNGLLTGAHKKAVTITEPTLTPKVQAAFAKVTGVGGLAELALSLENTAAQTYQAAAGKLLKSRRAIATAASIQPVEMQHAAILYFALGQYPGIQSSGGTPLAFNPTGLAA